ncbi:hypothetical protein BZA77DRAFT_294849 [Pyronema omphalodes]|nr:hypothetical protein BZA77DRAFT_294849 [Pyronema omphalodes]
MHATLLTTFLLSQCLFSSAAKIDPLAPPVPAIGNITCTPYSYRSRNPSDFRVCRTNIAEDYGVYEGIPRTPGISRVPVYPGASDKVPKCHGDTPEMAEKAESPVDSVDSVNPGISDISDKPGDPPSQSPSLPIPSPSDRCYQKNNQQPSTGRGCTKLCHCPGGSGGVFKAEKPQGDGLWIKVFSRPEKKGGIKLV